MASMRNLLATLAVSLACLASAVQANTSVVPQRVVSMNLCTDQLALLLADPDQLISVSFLASQPSASIMVEEAKAVHANRGLAEEIIRLDADLVLAGIYTTRPTVNMLKRLGRRVEEFQPSSSFEDIKANIRRMGDLLGHSERAETLVRIFEETRAAHLQSIIKPQQTLGSYGANNYTGGGGTLEAEIVKTAGLAHMGETLGLKGTSKMPLETLILKNPDIIMSWSRWSDNPTRSAEVLKHPALEKWFGPNRRIRVDSRYWICGAPFTLDAVDMVKQEIKKRETVQ